MRWLFAFLILVAMTGLARAGEVAPIGGTLRAPALWQAYRAAFVGSDGRVIDNANHDISHSEGQGYGMLLAAAADDRAAFDLMWSWTRAQLMLRDDGLAAWRWDPAATPHVGDRNNATDGDILIAWALAEAGDLWRDNAYKAASLQLAAVIADKAVVQGTLGTLLKPGMAGYSAKDRADGPVVNPSYWVFPGLLRLSAVAPGHPWDAAVKGGLDLLSVARFGPRSLPSDWVALAGGKPAPAKGFPPTFGYDAIRIPLYLVWGGFGSKANLAPYTTAWADPAVPPQRINVISGDVIEPFADSGYRAVAALTRCATAGRKIDVDLTAATVDRYYPTTLRALVLIAARQRYPQCL